MYFKEIKSEKNHALNVTLFSLQPLVNQRNDFPVLIKANTGPDTVFVSFITAVRATLSFYSFSTSYVTKGIRSELLETAIP